MTKKSTLISSKTQTFYIWVTLAGALTAASDSLFSTVPESTVDPIADEAIRISSLPEIPSSVGTAVAPASQEARR